MKTRRMTGSEAFTEALRLEGVEVIYGIVGSAFMDPLDIFNRAGIRFVQVRHEQSAALMAEGYGRAKGVPGVCIGQNGPGVTNLVTGLASAKLNHTPVVVITPAVPSTLMGTGAFQEIDQMDMLRSVTVHQVKVERGDRIGEAIRTAFRAAWALGGPAQVDIPRDYFYAEWDEPELRPHQYRTDGRRGGAPAGEIEKAAAMLAEAKNPVILAGLGVVRSGAAEKVAELAEMLGAPVATIFMHNDAFPMNHPLGLGPIGYQGSKAAMNVVSRADTILALGTRLNAFGLNTQYEIDFFPEDAKLIQNSHDPMELGAQKPIALGLLGDTAEVTAQLVEALSGAAISRDVGAVKAAVATEKDAWTKELEEMSDIDGEVMHPRRAVMEIAKALPENVTAVLDIGNVCGTAAAYLRPEKPGRYLGAGSLGGIGVSYATAIGAKMAQKDDPVCVIIGDGAWSMTLQEVMTAVTEKVNVVAILMNNNVYGAERRNQYDFFDERYFWTELENPSFSEIARNMGAVAKRITRPEEIAPALAEAFASEAPVVLEVMIDGKVLSEPYRRDALRRPKRHLPLYRN
ncbi:sulfoacetaldehyde acetyltransferase [Afifella sp. IM 167]|uniref:sulfoacetaldehyde acetyltransferase n=1 Tax=Afifella sp. IM 167 TaxID=2033586 RepID=UPI001CCD8C63|nr:sulfoacetaldehyde acetyltransferase [Afifella sp. IM 167]MBZ8132696.1 sulfoacetaldehyde acetyltransferase [Afifella sp. IM 167]